VSFVYQGDENVLDNISFSIEEREFVAFVEQSGAGKSTIVSLLTRFYRPDEGQILAGARPALEYELDSWRSRIAVVRQSPFIFNGSLRYNLTVGNREASQTELDRVCEIAHVNEFFDELPEGYDSVLGDDGTQLSGGTEATHRTRTGTSQRRRYPASGRSDQ
jgi:subfamily B ATP-binding cassette protein MsbA